MTGSGRGNPYMGILCYVVAPFFLACGLLLVIGGALKRRRELAILRGLGAPQPLAIDLSRDKDRRILGIFVALTMVYLLLTAVGSYQTYEYTESDTFCGRSATRSWGRNSQRTSRFAHARVACVDCHVGEGAAWFVNAKISGVRQLYRDHLQQVSRARYPTPVHNLRPARETCEHCHWPEKHSGNLERTDSPLPFRRGEHPRTRCASSLKVGGSGTRARQAGRHPLAHEQATPRSSTMRRTPSARRSRGCAVTDKDGHRDGLPQARVQGRSRSRG